MEQINETADTSNNINNNTITSFNNMLIEFINDLIHTFLLSRYNQRVFRPTKIDHTFFTGNYFLHRILYTDDGGHLISKDVQVMLIATKVKNIQEGREQIFPCECPAVSSLFDASAMKTRKGRTGAWAVHRLAPNAVLAERFNSVACLCAQPELMKFAEFAKRQRGTARVTK